MANGKTISGKDLLMYIKRSTDVDYLLAACQVDLTFTMSQDVSKETTKCGTSKSFAPVDANASINAEARVDIDEGDEALSWNDILNMQKNETQFSAAIFDKREDPDNPGEFLLGDKIYITGDAKFAQVELTADSTTSVKFSANIEYLEPGDIVTEKPTT